MKLKRQNISRRRDADSRTQAAVIYRSFRLPVARTASGLCLFFFLSFLLLLSAQIDTAAQAVTLQEEVRLLAPDETVTRELNKDETHLYELNAEAGRRLRLVVASPVNVTVTAFAPDQQKILDFDVTNRGSRTGDVLLITANEGRYRFALRMSRTNDAAQGSYEMRVAETPAATAQEMNAFTNRLIRAKQFSYGERLLEDALKKATLPEDLKVLRIALSNLLFENALALDMRGEEASAIPVYRRALDIARDGNPQMVREALLFLSKVYQARGERLHRQRAYEEAVSEYEKALPFARERQDVEAESAILEALITIHTTQGRLNRTFTYKERLVELAVQKNDPLWLANAYIGLGTGYQARGQYAQAIAIYEKALPLLAGRKFLILRVPILFNLASSYGALGSLDQALKKYQDVLSITRGEKQPQGEVFARMGISTVYFMQKRYRDALEHQEKALAIVRKYRKEVEEQQRKLRRDLDFQIREPDAYKLIVEAKPQVNEAVVLGKLSITYNSLGRKAEAEAALKASQDIFQAEKMITGQAWSLQNSGLIKRSERRYEEALNDFEQALTLHAEMSLPEGRAELLVELMRVGEEMGKPQLAIFYGMQAVNSFQETRQNNPNLDPRLQQSYLKSKEDVYRRLVSLLISEGRIPEALNVLKMLKEKELAKFARRDAITSALLRRTDLSESERNAITLYEQYSTEIINWAQKYNELKAKGVGSADPLFQEADARLRAARQTFLVFLRQLRDDFGKKDERRGTDRADRLRGSVGLINDLEKLKSSTVVLYTIVDEDNYRVVLTKPNNPPLVRAAAPAVPRRELEELVVKFRAAIDDENLDPLPLAKQLYRILIAPIAPDLEQAQAETLVWSLDDALRYLPLPALHDGNRYLVERYQNVVITLAGQPRLNKEPQTEWRALGLGVSDELGNFCPLPFVPEELDGIIREEGRPADARGIYGGTLMLNGQFKEAEMKRELATAGYRLVHIASHYKFAPSDKANSFLLLGDGQRFSLATLEVSPTRLFEGVELLTLSACDTATGSLNSGEEFESFAALAQEQGADAVLATLWSVADNSTSALLQRFYELRRTGKSKAEALQEAQKGMLRGEYAPSRQSDAAARRKPARKPDNSASATDECASDPDAPFTHPYYWAPLVLIGNWR